MKKVLVLGAGRISRPCIQHLLKEPDLNVVVVDQLLENAQKAIAGHPRGEAQSLEIQELDPIIKQSDLVISLLPPFLEREVVEKCITNKTSVIFPNYISPEIKELSNKIKDAGITVLGEVGLDPGIDHMSAVKIIDQVKDKGGKVLQFGSWCGGLPAPEAATEPIRYKFSWSPEGAISASERPARYTKEGIEISITGNDLMKNYSLKKVPECGWFEDYPNSDSLPYVDIYNIPEVKSIYRGTLRYPGWCETIASLHKMNMFDTRVENVENIPYLDFVLKKIGASKNRNVTLELADHLGIQEYSLVIKNIQWLGLLDENTIPFKRASAKDILADILLKKMKFEKNERDLVVMHHEFDVEYQDGNKNHITSTLIEYGYPEGDSAMARTTGLPIAITAKLIVQEEFKEIGVHLPVDKKLYKPVLRELEELGITLKEKYTIEG